jgi:acetolactate synthase-1/2/3 large subunit
MKEAFAMKDRLVFLDIITDQTENVYPMIQAGAAHNQMEISPDHQKRQGAINPEGELA